MVQPEKAEGGGGLQKIGGDSLSPCQGNDSVIRTFRGTTGLNNILDREGGGGLGKR